MGRRYGFTLSELLIALAILGVIAAFAIPKILLSQQEAKYNAVVKEVAGALSVSLSTIRISGNLNQATSTQDVINNLNYVAVDTSTTIDNLPTWGTLTCGSGPDGCVRLHSGAIIAYWTNAFCGTASNNALAFIVDPDGVEGSSGAVRLHLYANGWVRTFGTSESNTQWGSASSCSVTVNPDTSLDPDWFSWD